MTQVWFPRKNFPVLLRSMDLSGAAGLMAGRRSRSLRRWGPWAAGSWLVTVGVASDWRLVLATALGMGSLKLVYWLLTHRETLQSFSWQSVISTPQGQLMVAGGSAGMVALGTYLGTMVWSAVDNPWLGTALVLQGGGMVVALGLLVGQWGNTTRLPSAAHHTLDFERYLDSLAYGDRLQRFVALRQLNQRVQQQALTVSQQTDLIEALGFFCTVEKDPALQRTALTLWQTLHPKTAPTPQPLTIPQIQRQHQPIDAPS